MHITLCEVKARKAISMGLRQLQHVRVHARLASSWWVGWGDEPAAAPTLERGGEWIGGAAS